MGLRRKARQFAVQFLYGLDLNREEREESLRSFWNANRTSPAIREFAAELINGTLDHLDTIDQKIEEHSRNWKMGRIALVDKNILRIAVYELIFREDIPAAVSIDEAVEIARYFGTPDSGRFVNGILDNIQKESSNQ